MAKNKAAHFLFSLIFGLAICFFANGFNFKLYVGFGTSLKKEKAAASLDTTAFENLLAGYAALNDVELETY